MRRFDGATRISRHCGRVGRRENGPARNLQTLK
jgi:hypothetical protein